MLFELLDNFDLGHRHRILSSAYHCFKFGNDDGYLTETANEDMYHDFKKVFTEHASQFRPEDDARFRERYAVYGLISYLLVEALRRSEMGVYESFSFTNSKELKQFKEAIEGDDTARQRALAWSGKAFELLDRIHHAKSFYHKMSYRRFCNEVVERLLDPRDEV